MFISSRVKPMVNFITVGNISTELNSHSFPEDNSSKTQHKIAFMNTSIYKKIQPLILSLKLCGLFPIHENSGSFSSMWRCHFFFVFTLMVLNLLRSLSTFDPKNRLEPIFFMELQYTCWSLENLSNVVVFWVGLHRKRRIPLLFLKQDKLFRQCEGSFGNLRRIIVSMFVLTILIPVLGVIFHIVCHQMSPRLSELQFSSRWPKYLNKSWPSWLKVLFDISLVYLNSAISTSAICFLCFMCYLIGMNLKNLRIRIEKVTLGGFLADDLANYRYHFQELCDVIATLDRCFKYIIFLSLLMGTPLFCALFYQVIYFSKTLDETVFFSTLLSALIVYMSILLLLPAWIHSEMLMFLSQLTGPDIGLSACNIIIITRRTLLTVAGLLLTYFLLLVQYGDSSQDNGISNITKNN